MRNAHNYNIQYNLEKICAFLVNILPIMIRLWWVVSHGI